jgi:hypothetical protein
MDVRLFFHRTPVIETGAPRSRDAAKENSATSCETKGGDNLSMEKITGIVGQTAARLLVEAMKGEDKITCKMDLHQTMSSTSGNEKRKESCKAIGGAKKIRGHAIERVFKEQFGDRTPVTYRAEADALLPLGSYMSEIWKILGLLPDGSTSIKSGKNLQFTLGSIPEVTKSSEKIAALSDPTLWIKYLKKGESKNPATLLCYYDSSMWHFFKMDDVIEFIIAKGKWRELSSGRFKCDFDDDSKKGSRQYLTYEYRSTHKSYFLGANGGRGADFIKLLTKNLRHVDVPVSK